MASSDKTIAVCVFHYTRCGSWQSCKSTPKWVKGLPSLTDRWLRNTPLLDAQASDMNCLADIYPEHILLTASDWPKAQKSVFKQSLEK